MAYGNVKDLVRTKFEARWSIYIAKDPKYDGYQRGLVSMVYSFFDKSPLHL